MKVIRSKDPKISSVKLFSFLVLALLIVMAGTATADAEKTVVSYVYQGAAQDSADGSSWQTAFPTLQEALDVAAEGDQIWVAKGTYYPTYTGNRNESFQMKNGVAIYGGFAGTKFNLAERDYEENKTILSGDLGTLGDPSDNSYHVFYNDKIDSTAILDGFTITGGNADNGDSNNYGGGMYNYESGPALTNVEFRHNSAGYGNEGESGGYGGGMYNNKSSNPSFTNVTFSGNSAEYYGGGMYNNDISNPTITNCIFWSNASGQIDNLSSAPAITYSLIQDYDGDGEGNISDDPLFVSSEDLRIQAGSPAIDAGTNTPFEAGSAAYEVITDLDGNRRISNYTVDMGAYEYLYYPVTVVVGAGNGTVSAQVGGETLTSDFEVEPETIVTFSATPDPGWKFVRWDINGTTMTTSSPEVTVNSDITATVYFKQRPSSSGSSGWSPTVKYTLTMETEGQGTATPAAGTHSYKEGTLVTLKAQAQAGWEFTKWLISGKEAFDSETRIRVDKNTTAKAFFTQITPSPAEPVELILTIGSKVMLVDEQEILMDVAPFIDPQVSRTMLPIRFIAEWLGADVKWQPETNQVRIVLGDQEILLTIGSTTALVNGTATEMDCPAEIKDSRTFVPLRFISETLGAKVDWDGETRQITVTKKPLLRVD